IDFDKGLTDEQKGIAWATEKLCEDNLYWAAVYDRWLVEANFERGPKKFFDRAPAPLRPLIRSIVRRNIRRSLHVQGIARYERADIERIACAALDAISGILGSKRWIVDDKPSGADAAVWSFVTGALCPVFDGTITRHAQSLANLKAYSDRGKALWYPQGFGATA
ncbi:MAG: glutathione S-transferase family protein, partial [Proteobacteria bacterium]|nr:glutathione S-transferase family protein [Pseudomonadota bacterium]